ncbi:hypothetical protein DV738_g1151, partial [Chaetothyriales sp. CBS 135597]
MTEQKDSLQDTVGKAPTISTDVRPISRLDSPDSEPKEKLIQHYDSDPVLTRKVDLVNAAIDEIGMTPFQWKLFFLNGFGYGADTLLVLCQAVTQSAVTQEFGSPSKHIAGVYMASMVGLLVGAGLWGFSADIIGRKIAFNSSLFICALFVLIAGGMPSYVSFSAIQNRDDEVFTILKYMAEKYRRPLSLDLVHLQSLGVVRHSEKSVWSSTRLKKHFSGLFATRSLAYSTTLIMVNWFIIGIVSPLYTVFLPYYLASRGADTGANDSTNTYWRNYAIIQVCGLIGPAIAAGLIEVKWIGRRGTLAIGALITTALQFGYTQIKTNLQNIAISCAITAAGNIYYGTLYAYTPEILPTAHRGTGYGVCVILNRIGGIIAILIGSYANVATTAPLFPNMLIQGSTAECKLDIGFVNDPDADKDS